MNTRGNRGADGQFTGNVSGVKPYVMQRTTAFVLALVVLIGVPAAGGALSPASATPARVAAAAQATTPTSPYEESKPRPPSAAETRRRATTLAKNLAKALDGSSRTAIRNGVTVRLRLGSGRLSLRLQVKRGKSWSTVASSKATTKTTSLTLQPGTIGLKRLERGTIKSGKVAARFSLSLSDRGTKALVYSGFSLKKK